MSRWHPNARGRLEQAAHELFRERGYEQTTVVDIATRAGLTERTFFRHFADKREVFFSGSAVLEAELARAVEAAEPGVPAIEVVRIAVEAVSALMHVGRDLARERYRIVAAHADLQERNLIKRATLTSTLANALTRRGVPDAESLLAAEMGMTVFYVAFGRWLDDPAQRQFVDFVREDFERLKAVASGS